MLTYKRNWEQDGAASIDEITQFVKGCLAVVSFDDNCDFQVRVNETTGKIQYRRGTGEWQSAPGTGDNSYTVVTGGDTIINNLYKLPNLSNSDKYCTAAWSLAYAWADDCQDTMEIIDLLETITVEAIENFADSLIGWIPILSTFVNVVEFVHEGLAQPAIDFVRENCTDADAISLAANNIYCAFRKCLDANDDIKNWHGYVEYPSILDGTATFVYATGIPTWETFKEMIEAIAGTLDGSYAGWAIVGYGGFVTFALNNITSQSLIADAIAYAANAGLQRNVSDCGDCGDCSLFDGDNNMWEITLGSLQLDQCDGDDGIGNGGSGELEVWLNLPSLRTIQSVFFHSTAAASALKTSKCEIYNNETLVHTVFSVENATNNPPQNCNNNNFDNIGQVGNRVRFYETSVSSTIFSGIEVCWT